MFHEQLPFNYENYPSTRLDTIYDGVTVFTQGPGWAAHQDAVEEVRDLVLLAGKEVLAIDSTVRTLKGHWTVLHFAGVEFLHAA